MSLHLNSQLVRGHDLKVSATLPLAGKDISGESSYSDTAETGDKPKQLNISLQIKFNEAEALGALVSMAEAKDSAGRRVNYNIINRTAEAMRIRLVKFEGDMSVREDESLELWRVTFRLNEVRSVPEKVEARQAPAPVTDIDAEGETVSAAPPAEDAEEALELSAFEQWLKGIDDGLASDETAETA